MQSVLSFKETIIDSIARQTEKITGVVTGAPETVRIVVDATNNQQWGPTGPQMRAVSELTFQYQECNLALQTIFDRLASDPNSGTNWRNIYKSLLLLDYVIKNGSERVVNDARHSIYNIKVLTNVNHVDSEGIDRGISIRERAKQIVDLLSDTNRLREERIKAKSNRDKYSAAYGSETQAPFRRAGSPSSAWDDDYPSRSGASSGTRTPSAVGYADDDDPYGPTIPSRPRQVADPDFNDDDFPSEPRVPSTPTPAALVHTPVTPAPTPTLTPAPTLTPLLSSSSVAPVNSNWDPFGPTKSVDTEWDEFNPRGAPTIQPTVTVNSAPAVGNSWTSNTKQPYDISESLITPTSGLLINNTSITGTPLKTSSQSTFVSPQPSQTPKSTDPWAQTKLFDLSLGDKGTGPSASIATGKPLGSTVGSGGWMHTTTGTTTPTTPVTTTPTPPVYGLPPTMVYPGTGVVYPPVPQTFGTTPQWSF